MALGDRVRVRTNLALALMQRVRDSGANDQEAVVALLRGNLRALSANGITSGRGPIARHLASAYGSENFDQAVAAMRLALRYGSRDDDPEEWADMQAECGRVYASIPSGDHVERAIRHFEQALEVYTPHEHGHRWAQVHVVLGRTYSNRMFGLRERNVDEAARCLRAALTIEDPARDYERNRARSLGDVLFLAA